MVEETYDFGRHTGVCLEPRAILADYNAAEHSLTVYHSTQAPHMMQDIFSRHLGIPEANVRVICKDVGGSYGIKVHVYADEMATAALSVMLRRPVKFVADRLESFLTDIHAREHRAKVRLACTKAGEILAFDLDDLTAIGPYSVYPRTSGIEGNQVVNLTGGPYRHKQYRAKLNVVFTNKNVTCQYRAVGHPIAVALTEGIVDLAAAEARHGSGRVPAPEPDPRRRLSVHVPLGDQVREALAPQVPRQAARRSWTTRSCARSRPRCGRKASIAASASPR